MRLAQWWLAAAAFCTLSLAQAADFPVVIEAKRTAVLSAERAGVLDKFAIEPGQTVKKKQVLAELNATELRLEIKRQKHRLTYLQAKYENLRRLNQSGLAPDEEVAQVRMERDVVQAEISVLSHYISRSRIRAPFAGKVVERQVRQHEWVTAGQPLVSIVDPKTLRATANLPTPVAISLKLGAEHTIQIPALPAQPITVKVLSISPQVEVQSDTVHVVWQVIKPPVKLLAGMKGVLKLQMREE